MKKILFLPPLALARFFRSYSLPRGAFSRVLVSALILSLVLPLSMAGHAASRNADRDTSFDSKGYVRVPLTPASITPGSTLTIQAGETVVTVPVNGGSASSLSFAQSLYTVSGGTTSDSTTVRVTLQGAVGGEQINWSVTSPGTINGATLSAASSNISGTTASVTVTGKDVRRSVTIKATLNSDSNQTATTTVRFGAALPSGFLALFDPSATPYKNWSDAGAFCTQQGGKLPRVNNTTSYPSSSYTGSEPVDGFGSFGAAWPTGLPSDFYWTGTEITDYPGDSWGVVDYVGNVNANLDDQSGVSRVVCVP